jgi:molecular chaperone DnaK (HSP70)
MEQPDIVVGIDFGMTSTGVAYSTGPEWMNPETIQHWPGNLRGGIADKVDTKTAYDDQGRVTAWGFMVDAVAERQNHRCEELFKLYLDPEFEDPYNESPSLQEARMYFKDYLKCIHQAVVQYLGDVIPAFERKKVEFRFSVPTTWKNPAMIAETEQLIRNAGFGRDNPKHAAEITLTEAEAAAVYASKQQYAVGETYLVCDAGGGTSDINILKVVSSGIGQTELEPLTWVEGKAIGSTLIDFRVEKLIGSRLEALRYRFETSTATIAHRMIRDLSRFESFKCNLGDAAMDLPALRLPVPGLPSTTCRPEAGIEDGQMIITREELQGIFDEQIQRLTSLIDDQLRTLNRVMPHEKLDYLVLSGGLGSSYYLQNKLRERYCSGATIHTNMRDVAVLRVSKPQLAVCHGLVLDRIQQIKQKRSVYKERYCRNSYGTVVRHPFDPIKHSGLRFIVDPRDKQKWVENQIDWFIIQV